MRAVDRSALVPFSTEQMFELVREIDAYPEFLPWCTGARVIEETAAEQRASVSLGLGALNTEFTTRNQLERPERIGMQLESGPFSTLSGSWTFEAIGEDGCEVSLRLQFEFSSTVQDVLFGAAFEHVCNELVSAFVARAHAVYGHGR